MSVAETESGPMAVAEGDPAVETQNDPVAEVEKKPRQKVQSAKRTALAAQLFARLYSPGTGRTAEHIALQSLDAAEAFLQTAMEYGPRLIEKARAEAAEKARVETEARDALETAEKAEAEKAEAEADSK